MSVLCFGFGCNNSLVRRRAKLVENTLNSIEGIHCNEVQGAMYAFPQVRYVADGRVQWVPRGPWGGREERRRVVWGDFLRQWDSSDNLLIRGGGRGNFYGSGSVFSFWRILNLYKIFLVMNLFFAWIRIRINVRSRFESGSIGVTNFVRSWIRIKMMRIRNTGENGRDWEREKKDAERERGGDTCPRRSQQFCCVSYTYLMKLSYGKKVSQQVPWHVDWMTAKLSVAEPLFRL